MSDELKYLERWLQYGFFEDTHDIETELNIAIIAENVYNTQIPQIEGLDVRVLLLVASVNYFKSTKEQPNLQNIYDVLIPYNINNPYDSDNKINWMSSFLKEFKTINNIKQEQI